ncbi:MAG: diguanylate cyclase (GGDEF)-like protein [Cellvibrionaceae bacterium]|jgi:diguanylate cyclase (GGDEF)-like protein
MALDPNEKKAQSLRRGLILLLMGLQLVTVLLILSITYLSTSLGIDQQLSQLLDNSLDKSRRYTQSFLEKAYSPVKLSGQLLANNVFELNENTEQLESYFISQLEANPETTSIYFASARGGFYSVSRGKQSGFVSQIIGSGLDEDVDQNNSLNAVELDQDPGDGLWFQEETWYQKAVSEGNLITTNLNVVGSSISPEITVATPVYDENGNLLGVTGADVQLLSLSEFLSSLEKVESVSLFIFSDSGNMIAAPEILTNPHLSNLESSDVADSNKDVLSIERQAVALFESLAKTGNGKTAPENIRHDGQSYRLEYLPFDAQGGLKWTVGAYVLENSFLAQIRHGESRNALIALLILAVSLAIGWVLIRRTWQPFERFFHDVITDQLTNLFNRRFLENIGSKMYIRMLRNQHDVISIAVIDLDSFKKINQEFGNSVGNRVLKEFANFLTQTLSQEDIITRYSGDTFVVIFPGKNNESAISIMNRLRKKLDAWPLAIDDLLIRVTFSAGVETIDESTQIADAAFTDFIEVARKAMRNAKNKGRDRIISANLSNIQIKTEGT